jgi:hypothetical protein
MFWEAARVMVGGRSALRPHAESQTIAIVDETPSRSG